MLVTPIGHGLFPAHAGAAQTMQNKKRHFIWRYGTNLMAQQQAAVLTQRDAWQQAKQCQCMLKQQVIKFRLIYWLMAVNAEVQQHTAHICVNTCILSIVSDTHFIGSKRGKEAHLLQASCRCHRTPGSSSPSVPCRSSRAQPSYQGQPVHTVTTFCVPATETHRMEIATGWFLSVLRGQYQ